MLDESFGGFRADGRAFLTFGTDGSVRLRDAMTGDVLARLLTVASPATCAAFRADGRLVVAGFQDGSVRLCDPNNSLQIGPSRFMEHALDKVAFTPDGDSVAGIDIAGNSRIWHVPRPLPVETLDQLRLRIEARNGLRMENDHTIERLDIAAWRDRVEQLGRLEPSAIQPDVDPAWHEPIAREDEQTGNAFATIWHLDRLIAAHTGDWFLFARRARAWAMSDHFEKASADYERAEHLGSRDQVLDFQAHRVTECESVGHWAEALWYLNRLTDARPDDPLLHEYRAAIYGKLGREADPQKEIDTVFKLGADEGLVIPKAEQLARAGRWIEAAALLARCGRKGPLSRELAQAWSIACLRAGDRAGYREVCMADMAVQGSDPTVVWNALSAASLFALGPDGLDDYRTAIAWLERRLSTPAPLAPKVRHYFLNALAGLLLRSGRIEEAIARVNEGIAALKEMELATDWAYLALAHARKGNLAEARRWLDRFRAAPHDPQASFWDSEELGLLRGEAELLLFDTLFPNDPFRHPRAG
jgi:tetratricopeptide (TPR) repeat protein